MLRWVKNRDACWAHDVCCSDVGWAFDINSDHYWLIAFGHHNNVFEVEDDLGDIFSDAFNGVELVQCALELDS